MRLCEVCRGRAWVILGGARRACPRPGCEAGWVDELAPPFDVADMLDQLAELPGAAPGAAVDYWSHLAVARGVVERYRREVPEGAATSPPPDWLMWAVLLHRSLAGLVESIDALGGAPPPRPPWLTP